MHFVTDQYDRGPIFLNLRVPIKDDDTPDSLAQRVNQCEHQYQPRITDLVVNNEIRWDGKNPNTLIVPSVYSIDCDQGCNILGE